MRKYLIIALLAAFTGCEEAQEEGYVISGTVKNVPDGREIVVSRLNETNTQTVPVDTAVVKEGKFELDLPEVEQPTISFLTVEGARGNVLYIADNTPISFEIYGDSLYATQVTGGKDNEVLYNYLGKIRSTNKRMSDNRMAMQQAFTTQDTALLGTLQVTQQEIIDADMADKKKLVEENPNSIVSLMVLQDMINTQMYSTAELRELYEGLSPELQTTSLAKTIQENLEKLGRTDVGSMAPEFTAPTPEGAQLALKDALGEVTLVDFWASWCKPCRVENPNIVETYNKYHDKGFNIVQVSLDRPGQKDKWLEAIQEDDLGQWHHVSNLMFWQDPIAAEYGVRAIPAAFLLDAEGRIVAKNLRGDELGKMVGELVEGQK